MSTAANPLLPSAEGWIAERVAFIRALYGEEAPGHLALWRKADKKTRWIAAASLAEVASVQVQDDLYFAVALHDRAEALRQAGKTSATAVRGCCESAIAIPGFWADIDVQGPAHKAQDLPPTFDDARKILGQFPLEASYIVDSGYGLQAYWLFDELWVFSSPEEREGTQLLARRFHATLSAIAGEHGWKVDNVSDLARVLRLPGTYNAKLSPRVPVVIEEACLSNRYCPSEFDKYLVAPEVAEPQEQHPSVTTILEGVPDGNRDNALFHLAWTLAKAEVPRDVTTKLVLEAAGECHPPFPENEARQKVENAFQRASRGETVSFVGAQVEGFRPLQALPPAQMEAPRLTPDLLPVVLRPWLADIADRLQVPLEFTAVPAVAGAAGVVGRRVGICPKAEDDWLVIPNLWAGIIARPGQLKSPTLSETLKPVKKLAADERRAVEERAAASEAKLDALKAKEAALKDQLRSAFKPSPKLSASELEQRLAEVKGEIVAVEEQVRERRYVVNDTTTEKLGELLCVNPMGLLLERDELAGWLRNLERDGRQGDREFFLEAWNGTNAYTYDRISRGTLHIPALCLSIVGGIQPSKFAKYVSEALEGGYAADGLLQRFQLLVWPEDSTDWTLIDRTPDLAARREVYALFERLAGIQVPCEQGQEVPALRFSGCAQQLFYDWLTQLERRLRAPEIGACPAFESHLAKYRSLMPSLALLFHLMDSRVGSVEPVSLDAARLAADWCGYLEEHAQKVYAPELKGDLVAAHALAAKIRKKALHHGMTVRDLYRREWSGLRKRTTVESGLAQLEELGWVKVASVSTGGRASQVVLVNPEAISGGDNA